MRYAALGESFSVILSTRHTTPTRRIVGLRLHMFMHSFAPLIVSSHSISIRRWQGWPKRTALLPSLSICKSFDRCSCACADATECVRQCAKEGWKEKDGYRAGRFRFLFDFAATSIMLSLEMLEDSGGHQRSTALMSTAACHATQMTG